MTHLIPMSEAESGFEVPKRKKPVKLSDRSREYLKSRGYMVTFVERSYEIKKRVKGELTGESYWQKFDAFNVADLLAIKVGEPGTLYIQTTAASHAAEHKNTILGEMATRPILQTGNRIHLHAWKKKTVNKREVWVVQVWDCTLDEKMRVYFRELGVANDIDSGTKESASLFSDDPDDLF